MKRFGDLGGTVRRCGLSCCPRHCPKVWLDRPWERCRRLRPHVESESVLCASQLSANYRRCCPRCCPEEKISPRKSADIGYKLLILKWCPGAESNHRHCDFQSHALPTELPGRTGDAGGVPAGAAYRKGGGACPARTCQSWRSLKPGALPAAALRARPSRDGRPWSRMGRQRTKMRVGNAA